MAGAYGKLYNAAWSDPEFVGLTVEAQHVYFMLISSEQITFAGVAPFVPGRFIALAKNLTEKKFTAAVKELSSARFVVVDTSSQEILVRTFIKHDESLRNSNISVAVCKAIKTIYSPVIKQALADELAKLMALQPGLKGWEKLSELVPDFFEQVTERLLDGAPAADEAPPKTPRKAPSKGPSKGPSKAPREDPSEDPSEDAYPYPIRYPLE